MTPAPRSTARQAEPVACRFPTGTGTCGATATHELPAGAASNADPMPLCDTHAQRFLGAAGRLP
jgi:hypothetical protein